MFFADCEDRLLKPMPSIWATDLAPAKDKSGGPSPPLFVVEACCEAQQPLMLWRD
jgi:hypothetical protein